MSSYCSVSEENVARIHRQNKRKISVIIGNPPYNANQLNENENNKNRTYPDIDQRIKKTYIAASTAQKTKLYDMYARFFRWASDRLDENGIIAFVSNSSRDYAKADEKRDFLKVQRLSERKFEQIIPDKDSNWINLSDNDFDTLIPIASIQTKADKKNFTRKADFQII